MVMDFLVFSLIFVVLDIVLDVISIFTKIPGLDFLFFAPWLAAPIYGLSNALILAFVLFITHVIAHLAIAHLMLSALPAQVLAVVLGRSLGIGGFWTTLPVYYVVSTAIIILFGGLGGRYVLFLIINSVFNILLFITILQFFV